MKIYIASPYAAQQEINEIIYEKLISAGNEVFLPKSINIDAITPEERRHVAEICYHEIDRSDLILIVYPFGISVACEAGYSICQKIKGNSRKIVLYIHAGSDKIYNEAMFIPYVDFETDTIEELLEYVSSF